MIPTHRTQLEKIVLELQQRYEKAQFQLYLIENAKKYFETVYAIRKAIADEYEDLYSIVKEFYDEAVKTNRS